MRSQWNRRSAEQRILASPHGRPLGHRAAAFSKAMPHASEGRRGSHFFEQLRRIEQALSRNVLAHLCARARISQNSVAALQLFNALPSSLAL